MEVVKEGRVAGPDQWTADVECQKLTERNTEPEGCGAIIQINRGDLVLMKWYGTHFGHYYSGVRCPLCGKYTQVKGVPEPIWEVLRADENLSKAVFDGTDDSIC